MSHSHNQFALGFPAGPAHVLQYLPDDDDRGFAERHRPGITIGGPDSVPSLDDVGHAVTAGEVPDFWKPFEEWTLD